MGVPKMRNLVFGRYENKKSELRKVRKYELGDIDFALVYDTKSRRQKGDETRFKSKFWLRKIYSEERNLVKL